MDPTDAMDNERESRSSVRAQNGPSFQLRAEHARDVSMDFPTDDYVPIMPEPEDPSPTWETFPFVAKKFTPVMFWSWDVHSENCAICRVMLMEPCLQCQVNNRTSCVGKKYVPLHGKMYLKPQCWKAVEQ